jgi:multidrug resistance efflux pump
MQGAQARVSSQLPAEKASAEAALEQAEVELSKTVVRAGVSGQVEQFVLRVGDIVNPLMRPAGVLIPDDAGRTLLAGFGQIEAQIMKVGMTAEVTCVSKPFTISDARVQRTLNPNDVHGPLKLVERSGVRPVAVCWDSGLILRGVELGRPEKHAEQRYPRYRSR